MITFLSVEATSLALIGGAITIALGGFLRGFLGFGAALLIVPVLSALFGPEKALVITYFMEIPTIIYLMPNALKNGDVKTITPIILALFCTIPIGIYFLITIDPEIVKIVISILVLAMVALLASGWKPKGEIKLWTMISFGGLSGLINGAAGVGGPPFVTALMARNDSPERTRGNIILALSCMSLLTTGNYLYNGLVTVDLIILSSVAAPIYVGSTWIGSQYFNASGSTYFRKGALIMLALISVVTIVLSVS
jgi:uncharacterized membrane protein YfcA